MIREYSRALNPSERRLIRARIKQRQSHGRAYTRRMVWTALVLVALGAGVAAAIGGSRPTRDAWATFGLLSLLAVYLLADIPLHHRKLRRTLRAWEAGLSNGTAEVLACEATAFITFEEEEDEGAQYAFQVDPSTILILAGQHLYPSTTFPCLSFELVSVGAGPNTVLYEEVANHSRRVPPLRTISAKEKRDLRFVEHRQRLQGRLEDLEDLMRLPNRGAS